MGGNFGETKKIHNTLIGSKISIMPEVFLGTELMFKNNNGLNVLANYDFQGATLGANYVYEVGKKINFAFLNGLDGGMLIDTNPSNNIKSIQKFMLRYNLGIRFRSNNRALALNLKVPLFSNTFAYHLCNEDIKFNLYRGILLTIRYTYFFSF